MLNIIRKRSTVQLLIFGGLGTLFVLWGVGGTLGSRQSVEAGRIFGRKVPYSEYSRQRISLIRWLRLTFPQGDLPSQVLEQRTWQQLVLLHAARDRGLQVSDATVIDMIEQMPIFQRNGTFALDQYQRFLGYQQLMPRQFEEEMRERLLIDKLRAEMVGMIDTSEAASRVQFDAEHGRVRLRYVVITAAHLDPSVRNALRAVSPEALEQFFQEHRDEFLGPPQDVLAVIQFGPPTTTLNDDAPDTAELQQLLDVGWTIEELAENFSRPVASYTVAPGEVVPALGDVPDLAQFRVAAAPGAISAPLPMSDGLLIAQLVARAPGTAPPLAHIEEQVRARWLQDFFEQQMAGVAHQAYEALRVAPDESARDRVMTAYGLTLMEPAPLAPDDQLPAFVPELPASALLQRLTTQSLATWNAPVRMGDGWCVSQILERLPADEDAWTAARESYMAHRLRQQHGLAWLTFISELWQKAHVEVFVPSESAPREDP